MALRVWITGASSGIGAALARRYAARGASLGLVARRGDVLRELAASLPGRVFTYPLDVTDTAAQAAAAQDFMQRVGVPDIVIANAGVSAGTLTGADEDLEVFARIMAVNVQGMVNTFHPFVGSMRNGGRGRLVGIASVAGVRGLPGAGAYAASKAAAIAYLESLRIELHGSGVKVITVLPGYVETPMTAVNQYPMPFMLPVDEAARRIIRIIRRGDSYAVLPWQMAILARLLPLVPNALYDRILAHSIGRKPRGLPV
ncbi:SDR family oxidoreductase [Denitratisoma oestradiolicum]|uniref:Short-chain dehydrogenase n=1 Tax=Denitratisoma oestradiolicum TaxID=311182 RepID=A0A6S6XWL6_9PROT|nr:SDR family oxidoreductase [Denitratisoma oestradiolicum]TWO80911.1 short-chain dehydrogenase [Denitratisoma oestradiolicum]CAB1367322.1 Short-chain dehydrogenase [Denitratisoma oestradiolicum]